MKLSLKLILTALTASFAVGAIAQQAPQSLRGTDTAAADRPFDEKPYTGNRPGLQELYVRTFEKQPPLIPHAVTNFDEVTLQDNQCLECHGPDVYVKKQAPKVGDSHFIDRNGQKLDTIAGTRHACQLCHVPQADAKPLVDNTFDAGGPVTQANWKRPK